MLRTKWVEFPLAAILGKPIAKKMTVEKREFFQDAK
jgi:hypothetical protein